MDRTTTAIATASATNPIWLPWLEELSRGASLLLTLLGIVWLIVQIYYKLTEKR